MAVKGVFASDSGIQQNRKGDFASALLQYEPQGSAPMLALTAGMKSVDAGDTVVTWFEENRITGRCNVTNNATTGTSFVLDDASAVVAGQYYIVETTGEYVYIESVSGSTATVTRALADTTNTTINGSVTPVPIQLIGTAHEEGSSKPESYANVGFPVWNYMQIFRDPWDVTGTAKAVDFYTGDVIAKNRRDASVYHAEAIERSLLWGRQSIGTRNGKPWRMMDGVITQIRKRQNVSGAVTSESAGTKWSELDAFLMAVFSNNIKGAPNERIAFGDNTVLSVLGSIARLNGVIELTTGQTEFGMNVTKWITPYGAISVLTHPLMNEMAAFRGDLYLIHPAGVTTRYLRRTFEDTMDGMSGNDAEFGVYTTEMCVEYKGARTGGIYEGMSVAAAEA